MYICISMSRLFNSFLLLTTLPVKQNDFLRPDFHHFLPINYMFPWLDSSRSLWQPPC